MTDTTRVTMPPFEVAMGLGFTDRTALTIQEACDGWARIDRGADYGDAVAFNRTLTTEGQSADSLIRLTEEQNGFVSLLPRDWDEQYVSRWVPKASKQRTSVLDYALILRHTDHVADNRRKVRLVLGGFTERGTAAAGRYLADHWHSLWARFVDGEYDTPSRGDFLIIIAGLSSPQQFEEWREHQQFEVTPRRLRDLSIDCLWTRRLAGGANDVQRLPNGQ